MIRPVFACVVSAVLSAAVSVGVTFRAMRDLQPVVVAATPGEPAPYAPAAPRGTARTPSPSGGRVGSTSW